MADSTSPPPPALTGGAPAGRRGAEYALQICEALALEHAVSITHLDLKPQNLFLTRRETSS